MRAFGRFLQFIGLTVPPAAIVLQLLPGANGKPLITLGQMLVMLVAGVRAFYIGRILEGYASN